MLKNIKKDAKPLSNEECIELYKLANKGDKDAIEKLCRSVYGLVINRAQKFSTIYLSIEELFASGMIGVLTGIKNGRFNPKKGRWSTYITYYIEGFMHRQKDENGVVRGSNHFKIYPKCTHLGKYDTASHNRVDNRYVNKDTKTLNPKTEMEQIELKDSIKSVIHMMDFLLSDTERFVVKSYYLNSIGCREIGETVGVTKERIRQIRNKAIEKIQDFVGVA